MAYPFKNAPTTFKGYLKSLKDLAYTDNPFDKDFQSRLPEGRAYAFDDIKRRYVRIVQQKPDSRFVLLMGCW